MTFKVGDYVETSSDYCGVKPGEAGVIIDDTIQHSLILAFPAREEDARWGYTYGGFYVANWHLKLLCRFKYLPKGGK